MAGFDRGRALELYDWNAVICGSYIATSHYVEIALRTVIDITASRVLGNDWLNTTLFSPKTQATLSQAISRAGGAQATHDKVVAELSLGFWCSLLTDTYDHVLWRTSLQYAFDGSVRRKRLFADINQIRILRNRAAHHESLLRYDLKREYDRIVSVANRISPELSNHIISRSNFPQLIAEHQDFWDK
jgi:hypothetical protein